MKASGNGNIDLCVNNLLRTFRGEVPFERVKGIDPRLIDKPLETAEAEAQQDARWLLETYEPRATVTEIVTGNSDAVAGGFTITANITEKEE